MSTSAPITPPPTEAQVAEHAARIQYLQNQALMFMNNVRQLSIQLYLANMNGELTDQLKEHLYGELLKAAGIVEVPK